MYAQPATASQSEDGPFALPGFDRTVTEGVTPGQFDRVAPPEARGVGVREGDVVAVDQAQGQVPGPALAWVEDRPGTGVRLRWIDRDADPTTREEHALDTALETGRLRKLASNLSYEEARYLWTGEYDLPAAPNLSASDLTFTRERDWGTVRRFANHPLVGHDLGVNFPAQRAVFGARVGGPDGDLVAVVILTYATARQLDGERVIELKRYASHPNRPPNTASWLISRACRWAALEGYERLRTYAGVADNEGTIYQALGFECLDSDPVETDGDGWTNRDTERSSWDDYAKRRYECELAPDVPGIDRRGPPPEDDRDTEASLAAFGGGFDETATVADADAVATLSQADEDLAFGRRDQRPGAVRTALRTLGDETPGGVIDVDDTDRDTVTFTALAPTGIVAVLVATLPSEAPTQVRDDVQRRADGGTVVSPPSDVAGAGGPHTAVSEPCVRVVGYAAQETAYPHNVATTLVSRLREWSALEGYPVVAGDARPGTTLERAFEQAGFDELPATGTFGFSIPGQ